MGGRRGRGRGRGRGGGGGGRGRGRGEGAAAPKGARTEAGAVPGTRVLVFGGGRRRYRDAEGPKTEGPTGDRRADPYGALGTGGGSHAGAWEVDEEEAAAAGGEAVTVEFEVDKELFGHFVGRGGSKQKQLERETGASVRVPKANAPPGAAVEIAGTSGQVEAAKAKLRLLVEEALGSPQLPYTHFVGFPLDHPHVREAFARFRESVLRLSPSQRPGLDESVFWDARQLHLTVCMLKLYSDEARAKARRVLEEFQFAAFLPAGGPLRVRPAGLDVMNDDPAAADVLFLKVKDVGEEGALQRLADALVRAFAAGGLLLAKDDRPVKLHLTVLNSRIRGGGGGQGGGRTPFDARTVLKKFGGASFGECDLGTVHVSTRGAFREEDGYYRPLVACEMR